MKRSPHHATKFDNHVLMPDAFLCPISFEVMKDPVILMDGHTYERKNIDQWLANNDRSPKTNLVLINKTVVPNHTLKSAIDYFESIVKKSKQHATPRSKPVS